MSEVIPESEWVWQGHAGHFCGADYCKFRLSTRVGSYLISTIGDYLPAGTNTCTPLTSDPTSFFETSVFRAGEALECGCTYMDSPSPLEGVHYETAAAAQRGHVDLCKKYAGLVYCRLSATTF
jgi:hypothetical protein